MNSKDLLYSDVLMYAELAHINLNSEQNYKSARDALFRNLIHALSKAKKCNYFKAKQLLSQNLLEEKRATLQSDNKKYLSLRKERKDLIQHIVNNIDSYYSDCASVHVKINLRATIEKRVREEIRISFTSGSKHPDYYQKIHSHLVRNGLLSINLLILNKH